MEILHNIKKSIYSQDYYGELLAKPFSYSWKYYFSFITVLSLVLTLAFSFYFIPKVALFADVASKKIIEHFPAELKITVNGGKVSTNVAEPYAIAMPQELKNDSSIKINNTDAKQFKNFLVIDTNGQVSIDQFKTYDTAVLLTRDSIVAYGENGKISVQPLDPKMNFILDRPTVEYWVGRVKPFVPFIYPILIFFIFIGCFMMHVFMLVYLLFGALLVWAVARLKGMQIGYGKSYQLGIHLMTAGILIGAIINIIGFYSGFWFHIPFMTSILLVILAVVNVKRINEIIVPI